MAGLSFDDIPAVAAAPVSAPAPAASGALTFDDIPSQAGAASAARSLTITPQGSPPPQALGGATGSWDDSPSLLGSAGQVIGDGASYVNNLVRQTANAVPILGGMANTLDGATASLFNGRSPDENLTAQNQNDAQFSNAHPYVSTAAGLAGGGAGAMAMLPAEGLGMVGGLGSRVLGGAVGGGALGAGDSVVRGENPLWGGALGAAGGAAGPLVGAAAGAGARSLAFAQAPVPQALQGTPALARKWLAQGLDGWTPEALANRSTELGPHAFAGELTPSLLATTGSIAKNNGPGRDIVRDAFQARADGTNSRVVAARNAAFGPSVSPEAYKGVIEAATQKAAEQTGAIVGQGGPVDVSRLVEALNKRAPQVADGSPEAIAIAKARTLLTKPAPPPEPVPNPWEPDVGEVEPEGQPRPLAPLEDDSLSERPTPPPSPRPVPLDQFIRKAGGIQDKGGDLAAMGRQSLIAAPGKGLGADAMRQAAAQAGYLGANIDHAMAETDVNDLLDAIGTGKPVHSVFDDQAAQDWASYDAARSRYMGPPGPQPKPAAPQRVPTDAYEQDIGEPWGPAPAQPPGPARVPITDPVTAYSARKALDHMIQYGVDGVPVDSATRDANSAFQRARAGTAAALDASVPGYQDNMDLIKSLIQRREAVDTGAAATAPGKSVRPDDHAVQWAGAPPAQQAAQRVGMLSNLDAAIGKGRNDFQAAVNHFQGNPGDPEVGWNQQKYQTAFGEKPVADFDKALTQEQTFKRNTQRVAGGSQTAPNQEEQKLTLPSTESGMMGAWNTLYNARPIDQPGSILPKAFSPERLAERFSGKAYEDARTAAAPLLVKQGADRDALVSALMQMQAQKAGLAQAGATPAMLAHMLTVFGAQAARQQMKE